MNRLARSRGLSLCPVPVIAALAILPFAAAVPAQAESIVLPTGNFQCWSNPSGCVGAGAVQDPDPGTGMQGVTLFVPFMDFAPGAQPASVGMSSSGALGGTDALEAGTSIQVDYSFLFLLGGVSASGWSMSFTLYDLDTNATIGWANAGGGAGNYASGTSTLTIEDSVQPGTNIRVEGALTAFDDTGFPSPLVEASFDFIPQDNGTPEPGTGGVAATALAGGAILLRRLRRRTRAGSRL